MRSSDADCICTCISGFLGQNPTGALRLNLAAGGLPVPMHPIAPNRGYAIVQTNPMMDQTDPSSGGGTGGGVGHSSPAALPRGRHFEGRKYKIVKIGRFWQIDVCIAERVGS